MSHPALHADGQRGYSLIELLIAIAIAIFLIGGVLVVEQSMHRSYTDQTGLSQIEDTERFTMTMLGEITQAAGYYPDPAQTSLVSALPQESTTAPNGASDPLSFAAGQAIDGDSGTATVNGTTVSSDSIAVRYMTSSGDGISLCNGQSNTTGSNQVYVNYLYTQSDAGGQHYLYCLVQDESNNGAWSAPIQLAKNVQNMQIWYGLNTQGTGNNIDTYVPAPDMTTSDWMHITSVKVLVTFTNPLHAVYKEQGQKQVLLFTKVISVMSRTGS